MRSIDTLKKHLRQASDSLSDHRIDLIGKFLNALLIVRSANLMKVATAMAGPAVKMSRYRRLQRFFSAEVPTAVFSELIVKKVVQPGKRLFVKLAIDRTHWKRGQKHQNLLCLGLIHHGVSIPLECLALGKAGNSNTRERKQVIRQAWQYLKDYTCCLLADREFIGIEWLSFLLDLPGMEFIIRIRCTGWIRLANGKEHLLNHLVRNLPKGQTRIYENVVLYESKERIGVHLVCHRSSKGELVLLATNRQDLHQVVALYKERWSIETAFAFLKSRGFDLEETHLTHPKRVQRLLALLSLALFWALLVGVEEALHKPIALKKHGRKAISVVRLGLDHLQDAIHNIDNQWRTFRAYCRLLLSCT